MSQFFCMVLDEGLGNLSKHSKSSWCQASSVCKLYRQSAAFQGSLRERIYGSGSILLLLHTQS